MLKKILFVFAVLLWTSCDKDDECIKAQGDELLMVRSVDDFHTLRVSLSALVQLEVDSQLLDPEVRVIAQSNIHERISSNVTGGVLNIAYTECIDELKEVDIVVKTPSLDKIEIEGPAIISTKEIIEQSRLDVFGNASGDCNLLVNLDTLIVESRGSGELNFAGYSKHGIIRLETSADFFGFELSIDSLTAHINASGNAQVRTNELLTVDMNGSGNVLYKGFPFLDVSGSGSGDVINVN